MMVAAAAVLCAVPTRLLAQGTFATPPPTATGFAQPKIVNMQNNGGTIQLPGGYPFSRKTGFSMEVDTRWAPSYGYRPLLVRFRSNAPVKRDHVLSIRLHSTGRGFQPFSGAGGGIVAEQSMEIRSGSTTAETTVLFPQYQTADFQYLWWEVRVDGILDEELSVDLMTAIQSMPILNSGVVALSLLVVGPESLSRQLHTASAAGFNTLVLPVAEFPGEWLQYTAFDAIALTLTELELLATTRGDALHAVGLWVQAGGQLWVDGVDDEWSQLRRIEELLRLNERPAPIPDPVDEPAGAPGGDAGDGARSEAAAEGTGDEVAPAEVVPAEVPPAEDIAEGQPGEAAEGDFERAVTPLIRGWRPIRFRRGAPEGRSVSFVDLATGEVRIERNPRVIAELLKDSDLVATEQPMAIETADANNGERRGGPRDSSRWFLDHRLGLGTVRAFQVPHPIGVKLPNPFIMGHINNPLDVDSESAEASIAFALQALRSWESRHGLAPDRANADFANWLVPGVGLAPVTEFSILITLFVLLIGPVNYWVLRRLHRLHLLVLTVPAAALLVTATLFTYALLSDGFRTLVRVGSVTTLDQRTGEAACWARLSYYAGLAPSRGLEFPRDVALYPIIPGWNESSAQSNINSAREIVWDENAARHTRGWLRSRTPTQYLAVRARKTPASLQLASTGERMRAANRLGTAIRYVVAVDQSGKLFAGSDIGSDATVMLEPVERSEAVRQVRQFILGNEPEPPPGLTGGDSDFALFEQRRQRRMMSRQYGLQYSEQRLGSNLQSDLLADLAGISGQPPLMLPLRSYLAVTETGPEVELGFPAATEEASFHVLLGLW